MNRNIAFESPLVSSTVVLSVFPKQEDHASLRSILRCSDWPPVRGPEWELKTGHNLEEALPILSGGQVSVVLCERDLPRGNWKDMVAEVSRLSDPPYLIVTSRQADDLLWVEALNLGAYDVLQTPFHATEVTRTLGMAWTRWVERHKPALARAGRSVA